MTIKSDSAARGKIEAVEVYLRAEGFADVETDPPGVILPAHFHIVRAVTSHGERRVLWLSKEWLYWKPTAEAVVALLERKGVARSLNHHPRDITVVNDEQISGIDA